MHQVVLNGCCGGFSLSREACEALQALGVDVDSDYDGDGYLYDVPRHDPRLVQVVQNLGFHRASGSTACLYVETIPGNRYRIEEYDGRETLHTPEDIRWTVIE
jgi:hypothetical protein